MEKCHTVIYANEKQSRASDCSIRVIALVSGWRRQTNITAQLEFFIKEMTRSCREKSFLFTTLGLFGEQQMNIMQQPILRSQDSDIYHSETLWIKQILRLYIITVQKSVSVFPLNLTKIHVVSPKGLICWFKPRVWIKDSFLEPWVSPPGILSGTHQRNVNDFVWLCRR